MSNFTIRAEQFMRLAGIVSYFASNVSDENKQLINTIRLENKGGQSVAVVTNQKIVAVETLGPTVHPDGVCHVKFTPQLMEAANRAAQMNLTMTFMLTPMIAMSVVQIGIGEYVQDVCHWFEYTPLDKWRSWLVDDAMVSEGIMCWDLYHVESLIRSSPSGKVVFPQNINVSQPLMIRDRYNNGWVGLFMPTGELPPDTIHAMTNRIQPSWLRS